MPPQKITNVLDAEKQAYQFQNKPALFEAVSEECLRLKINELIIPQTPHPEPEDRLSNENHSSLMSTRVDNF